MRTKLMRKCAVLGACLGVAYAALANTVYVSLEYGSDETGEGTRAKPMKTIQAGVNKLNDWGSTLYISNGVYKLEAPIDFQDKTGQNGVSVRSMSGNPADVIIDGQNAVRCLQGAGYNKYFYGLTFQNGYSTASGAGIYLSGTTYIISNCVVRNCHTVASGDARGGGLYVTRDLRIYDTAFYDCSVESPSRAEGGGFAIGYTYNESAESVSTIRNVVVSNCVARGAGTVRGGGLSINRSNVDGLQVLDCQALNTAASPTSLKGEGGGVYKLCYGENTFENVLITNCLSNSHGGGLGTGGSADGKLHVRNCSFVGNRIEAKPSDKNAQGGGAFLNAAVFDVSQCRFSNNHVVTTANNTGDGAGVRLGGQATLADCVLTDNVTDKGQGGGFYSSSSVTISNCVIAANSAYGKGAFQLEGCKGVLMTDVFCISNAASSLSIGRINCPSSFTNVIRNSYFTGNGGETGQYQASLSILASAANSAVSFEYCTFVSNLVNSSQSYVMSPSVDNPAAETPSPSASNLFVKGCVFSSNSGKAAFPKCMNTVTNITSTYSDTFRADWWTTERRLNNYNKALLGNELPFVDLATDRRLKKGCELIDRGVTEAWMGDGSKRGQLDMGDGHYTIGKVGDYGVTVIRSNAHPRLSNGIPDLGCFEYYLPPGLMLLFR